MKTYMRLSALLATLMLSHIGMADDWHHYGSGQYSQTGISRSSIHLAMQQGYGGSYGYSGLDFASSYGHHGCGYGGGHSQIQYRNGYPGNNYFGGGSYGSGYGGNHYGTGNYSDNHFGGRRISR